MSEVILNGSNFEQEVINSDIPVLVDFWATWCGPCKMIAPIISQIAVKYSGKIKVGKVDVDEAPELAESFNVSSIPTLVLFKNGEAVAQRVGGAGMGVLEAFINDNI
ncbi:MAG: thioredoxin [Spirochaetales bacterium]|nr:thioredoxin [Spirochaetales bacterium]MBR5098992.1 thioredoxin [Spirochaetales bacterium]